MAELENRVDGYASDALAADQTRHESLHLSNSQMKEAVVVSRSQESLDAVFKASSRRRLHRERRSCRCQLCQAYVSVQIAFASQRLAKECPRWRASEKRFVSWRRLQASRNSIPPFQGSFGRLFHTICSADASVLARVCVRPPPPPRGIMPCPPHCAKQCDVDAMTAHDFNKGILRLSPANPCCTYSRCDPPHHAMRQRSAQAGLPRVEGRLAASFPAAQHRSVVR